MHEHSSTIGPWDGRLECALRLALPSFVHRQNNALAAVVGFASIAERSGTGIDPERTAVVHAQSARAVALARALSEIAKPTDGVSEPLDLASWLESERDFLSGCIESMGSSLEVRLGVESARVTAAPRPLAQALFVALVEAAASGGGPIVLTIEPDTDGRVALELAAHRAGRELPERIVKLAGASVCRRRSDGDNASMRWSFEAIAPVAARARVDALHVVLVERDPHQRELVEQVLVEDGYRVSAFERAEQWTGSDAPRALLVDSVTACTPAVIDLVERAGGQVPVAIMGRAAAPIDRAWPQLAKPFRPGELLDCVAGLVGA